MLNIKGGIKPDSHKYTKNIPIATIPSPETVTLRTYNDVPCVALGECVSIGQKLTLNFKAHASISGEVVKVDNDGITIRNDGSSNTHESCRPYSKKLQESSYEELISFISEKGIYYSDRFLDEKLCCAKDNAKVLVISCGETTPFSCSKYKTLSEYKKEIIFGTRIVMKALALSKAIITLEAFDYKNLFAFKELTKTAKSISIVTHSSKYPTDHPEVLKKAIYNKYFYSDKNFKRENILILSCEEVVALFSAFKTGLPMINRIITVDGDVVNDPQNVIAPLGISSECLLDFCNIDGDKASRIILNNPFCSSEIKSDFNIQKDTCTILALSDIFVKAESGDCISCKKCQSVCPSGLNPKENLDKNLKSEKCISCGSCTYICPAKIDFSQIYNLTEETLYVESDLC